MHFGGWAGWPAWLRDGSSLRGSGPLPQRLTVADDLRVLANLLDHGKLNLLVDRVARNVNQPIGPLGALSLANAPTLFDALGSLARLSNIHRRYFDASVVFEGEMAVFLLERRLPATGLADVIAVLGDEFARLRIGIGPVPPAWQAVDFVLGKFAADEQPAANAALDRAADAAVAWVREGLTSTMNQYNRKASP